MILPDHEITRQVAGGSIGIEPFRFDQVQPASYDLRLDRYFRTYKTSSQVLDPKSCERRTFLVEGDQHILRDNHFCLASTVEKIRMPDHLVGRVEGKSSLARMGLFVHVTAGFIDPGFEGYITLELFNANWMPIKLYAGMPIAQISFERLHNPAYRPYGHDALNSKYKNDSPGPAESMYYKNFQDRS